MWILPLDISLAVTIPHEIAGALVRAVDAGQTVVVHGATDEACCGVLNLVRMFAGGGGPDWFVSLAQARLRTRSAELS